MQSLRLAITVASMPHALVNSVYVRKNITEMDLSAVRTIRIIIVSDFSLL